MEQVEGRVPPTKSALQLALMNRTRCAWLRHRRILRGSVFLARDGLARETEKEDNNLQEKQKISGRSPVAVKQNSRTRINR